MGTHELPSSGAPDHALVAQVTNRGRIGWAAVLVGLLAAAALCALLFDGDVALFFTILLVSGDIVIAVALVFYEVGLSEDRERAREAERRRGSP